MLETLHHALGDRYAIEGEATRGGMAIIYRAEDRKHHRTVAIKVLRPDLAVTLGPERFFREIDIAARLIHPHILPLHDSGEAEGLLYYVMPYVAGDTLRQRLGRDRKMPIPEVIALLRQILDALGYAHAEGVVHRDIKPENLMLAGRNAMLIDFGVAKAISLAAAHPAGRPTLGVALGTPEYMSPEQVVSNPGIDHRTDIYAIGVMAYEMLAGGPPCTHKEPQRVLSAQINLEPRPVTDHRQVPAYLAELVMRSLKKAPSERWQSADEMLVQLDQEVPGRPSARQMRTPLPGPAGLEPIEPAGRRRVEVIVLGIFAALVLALVAAAVLVMRRPVGP